MLQGTEKNGTENIFLVKFLQRTNGDHMQRPLNLEG
jgi:hypothetical protein